MKVIYNSTISEKIKAAIDEAKQAGKSIDYIELAGDEFKELNESHGSQIGHFLNWGVDTKEAFSPNKYSFEDVVIKVIGK